MPKEVPISRGEDRHDEPIGTEDGLESILAGTSRPTNPQDLLHNDRSLHSSRPPGPAASQAAHPSPPTIKRPQLITHISDGPPPLSDRYSRQQYAAMHSSPYFDPPRMSSPTKPPLWTLQSKPGDSLPPFASFVQQGLMVPHPDALPPLRTIARDPAIGADDGFPLSPASANPSNVSNSPAWSGLDSRGPPFPRHQGASALMVEPGRVGGGSQSRAESSRVATLRTREARLPQMARPVSSPTHSPQAWFSLATPETTRSLAGWNVEEIRAYDIGFADAVRAVENGSVGLGQQDYGHPIRVPRDGPNLQPWLPPPGPPAAPGPAGRHDEGTGRRAPTASSTEAKWSPYFRPPSFPAGRARTSAAVPSEHSQRPSHLMPDREYDRRHHHTPFDPYDTPAYYANHPNLSNTGVGPGRGQRQLISCYPCRGRKLKCDGETPCSQCVRRGSESACAYASHVRRRGKGKRREDGSDSASQSGSVAMSRTEGSSGDTNSHGLRELSNDGEMDELREVKAEPMGDDGFPPRYLYPQPTSATHQESPLS